MELTSDSEQMPAEPNTEGESADSHPSPAPEPPGQETPQKRRPTPDEALAEMRRSLREEEPAPQTETGLRATLNGVKRRLFKKKTGPVGNPPEEPIEDYRLPEIEGPALERRIRPQPEIAPTPTTEEATPAAQDKPATTVLFKPGMDSGLDFGAYARTRYTEEPVREAAPTPQVPHSILTSLREPGVAKEDDAAVLRQEALQDYLLTPEEPEEEHGPAYLRSLRRSWRYMRSTEKRLLIGALIIIGLTTLAGTGFLAVKSLPAPAATATPTYSGRPFPISVSLPGGWVFPLRTGSVDENGKWDPVGAEWLEGTEICRWVSLPWTIQLEAVMHTLKRDDEIKLTMSNYDTLTYKVRSVEQIPSSQISDPATNTPSLFLILSKGLSDSRWVVTAAP